MNHQHSCSGGIGVSCLHLCLLARCRYGQMHLCAGRSLHKGGRNGFNTKASSHVTVVRQQVNSAATQMVKLNEGASREMGAPVLRLIVFTQWPCPFKLQAEGAGGRQRQS